MNITIEKRPKYTKLKFKDQLNSRTAPLLKTELVVLIGKEEKNFLLDLSKCTSCDETGVNALQLANRLCKNANGTLVIGGITKEVEHILEITKIDKELNLSYNMNKAEAMLLNLIRS